jgi:hypothetical protein
MAVTVLSFQDQVDGQLVNRSYVNDNFGDINNYLAGTAPLDDLDKPYYSTPVTLFTGDLTNGSSVIHTVALPGQASLGATAALYEIQNTRGGGTSDAGAVSWTYYSTWADAYNNTTGNALLTVTFSDDADGGVFIKTTSIPSALATAVTNNTPFYVRVAASEHDAIDICTTLWLKVKHEQGTLES